MKISTLNNYKYNNVDCFMIGLFTERVEIYGPSLIVCLMEVYKKHLRYYITILTKYFPNLSSQSK